MISIDENELSRLTTLSTDDLYCEIGERLDTEKSMMPTPRARLASRAHRWCDERLAPALCANTQLRAIAKEDLSTHEQIVAVTGLLDVVTHILGGVPTITVAVLIVRIGLNRFCANCWGRAQAPTSDEH